MKKRVAIILAIVLFVSIIPIAAVPADAATSNNVMVSVPWDKINRCGHQVFSGPCQAYCWAYCRIILDNTDHTYRDYWIDGVGGVAPATAGYNDYKRSTSQSEMLKTVYDNINMGRPVMIEVQGTPGNVHFVVAIGYKGGANRERLTTSDILILNPSNSAINVTAGSNETYTYLDSCTLLAGYACWTAKYGGTEVKNAPSNGSTSPEPLPSTQPQPPTVTSTENGSWTITIPANYKLLLYSSETAANSITYVSARADSYRVGCSKKAVLSNGMIRYYGAFNANDHYWLTYTNGMTIDDGNVTKIHTVNFNANGGSVSPSYKQVAADGTYGDLPTPTRNGYTFDGWYTAANGGTQVTSSTSVNLTNDQVTLYAHWTSGASMGYTLETGLWDITIPANCPVTYYAGPGSMVVSHYEPGQSSAYRNVNFNTRAILSDGSIRFKYAEDKWFEVTSVMSVEDRMNPTYMVTLNANGGSVSPSTITVKKGGTYDTLPQPTRTGYAFAGWYTAAEGGTRVEVTSGLSVNANHTLYAHWNNIFQATLDPNGGTVLGSSSPIKVEYQDSDYFPVASRSGYTFDGWYTERIGGEKITSGWIRFSEGAYFYAHWTPAAKESYTVTFDSLGGTRADPASIEIQKGGTYGTLPFVFGPTFGSTLIGWFTEPTGGTQVREGDPLVANANHTLYAHYRKDLYTITFDPNGGTVTRQFTEDMSEHSQEYIVGANTSGYGDLPSASRTGYKFLGWYTAPVGGAQVVKGMSYIVQDDHTLYAHWG